MSDDIIVSVLFGIERRVVPPAHAALPTPPIPLVASGVAVGRLIVQRSAAWSAAAVPGARTDSTPTVVPSGIEAARTPAT
jgi:hypothetical protein